MGKKTAVAAAVVELFGREAIEAYLSPAQCDEVENFAVLTMDHQLEVEAFTIEARAIFGRVFPTLPDFATWKPVIASIKAQLGDYNAKAFRNACKALHGKLPSAGTGKGSGSKGMSPKRFASGLDTRVQAVVEYITSAKKLDINAAMLARVTKAAEAMLEASDSLKRAVNE